MHRHFFVKVLTSSPYSELTPIITQLVDKNAKSNLLLKINLVAYAKCNGKFYNMQNTTVHFYRTSTKDSISRAQYFNCFPN